MSYLKPDKIREIRRHADRFHLFVWLSLFTRAFNVTPQTTSGGIAVDQED